MIHKHRIAALAGAMLLAASGIALAAGDWSNLPVIGGSAYCSSYIGSPTGQATATGTGGGTGAGAVCGQTVPAGPLSSTGEELIPMDVGGNGGSPTQTVLMPNSLIGGFNTHRNRIIGGDFALNLWQRGTTPVSGASPTTFVMSADRFFAISASNVMTVSKITPTSSAADYLGNLGLNSWMRVARPSGTPSGSSCVGQILDQKAAQFLLGNNGIFSFYGYAPATFSASNSQVSVSVAYYTAADSATPGTNTATFALSASGQSSGIAGYTAAVAGTSPGTTGTLANGVETISLTTTPTRYSVYAPIPAANASGTPVIGVGVSICATPTIATTVATDYFEIEGVQLQSFSSGATTALPAGVTSGSGFERRFAADEALLQLAYSYVLTDGAATLRYGIGQDLTTSTANLFLQFPEQMREVPALTVGTTISFGVTQAAGTAQACGTSIAGVASSLTIDGDTLVCTTGATNLVAGNATQFTGAATGGLLTYSAEP